MHRFFSLYYSSIWELNPFTTGNPFLRTKLLGFSVGRGSGAPKGLRPPRKTDFEKIKTATYRMKTPIWPTKVHNGNHEKQKMAYFGRFWVKNPPSFRNYFRQKLLPVPSTVACVVRGKGAWHTRCPLDLPAHRTELYVCRDHRVRWGKGVTSSKFSRFCSGGPEQRARRWLTFLSLRDRLDTRRRAFPLFVARSPPPV